MAFTYSPTTALKTREVYEQYQSTEKVEQREENTSKETIQPLTLVVRDAAIRNTSCKTI